jgi:hypothetical protein
VSRTLSFLLACCLLFACSSGDIPKNVLPPQKMNDVLWDILQADELASLQIQKDSSLTLTTHTGQYYQNIFALHKITREQFEHSLRFYQNHPPLFKPIVESLHRRKYERAEIENQTRLLRLTGLRYF